MHRNLTANVYLVRRNKEELKHRITDAGKVRRSLG